MEKKIYYLKFTTPFRFGTDKGSGGLANTSMVCHADTLFSAVAIEWLHHYGQKGLDLLIDEVKKDQFFLSDLMPYKENDLYLPRPLLINQRKEQNPDKIKAEKKLEYLSVNCYETYIQECLRKCDSPLPEVTMFVMNDHRVRVSKTSSEKAEPYFVAGKTFLRDAGFYLMTEMDEATYPDFDDVLESLGETGIGGKRSSGFGKFEVIKCLFVDGDHFTESESALKKLWLQDGDLFINLSALLPEATEIDVVKNGTYALIQRKGFVYSDDYANETVKRKQVTMINRGSSFEEKIKGRLVDLSSNGRHPVYRYGKGLYIGVNV